MNASILTQRASRHRGPRRVSSPPNVSATSRGTARARILLVEDDFIVAGELAFWLQDANFDVTVPRRPLTTLCG